MDEFAEQIKYWSDHLNRDQEKIDALHLKMYAVPFVPLNLEETMELRFILEHQRSIISLLSEDVKIEMDRRIPFWKRLFRKK
jgi:hypothetical protein